MRVVRFKLAEMWHRGSLVSIATRLRDGRSTDQTSIHGKSKIMYSSQQRPDRYWERHTSYRVGTGTFSKAESGRGVKLSSLVQRRGYNLVEIYF